MTRPLHIVIATLVAPLTVVPVTALFFALLGVPNTSNLEAFGTGANIGAIGLVYAYATTIVYGLPVFLVLWRFARLNVWSLSAAGFLPPLALAAIPSFPWRITVWWALCGLAAALAAWAIACGWPRWRPNPSVKQDALKRASYFKR